MEDKKHGKFIFINISIITTISPSILCLEETLGTLEYAKRAKSIKNQPEQNMKMTSQNLLKDMTSEIDQLKLELTSSRLKNGVYLPVETYNEKMELIETQAKTIAALEDEVDLTKRKLKEIQDIIEEYKNNYKMEVERHQQTSAELTQTQIRNKEIEEELKKKTEEVEIKKYIIEEKKKTEKLLFNEAETLTQIIRGCIYDLNQCHDKMDLSKEVIIFNKDHSQKYTDSSIQKLKNLSTKVELFNQRFGNSKNEYLLSISQYNEKKQKELDLFKGEIEKMNQFHETTTQSLFNLLNQNLESGKKRIENMITTQGVSEKRIKEIITNSHSVLKEFILNLENSLKIQKVENSKLNNFIQQEYIKNTELISTFTDLIEKLLVNYQDKIIESSNLQTSLLEHQKGLLKKSESDQLQRLQGYKGEILKGVEGLIEELITKETSNYHSTSTHIQNNISKMIVKNEELEKEFGDFNTQINQKNLEFKKNFTNSNQKSHEECTNLLKNGIQTMNETNQKSKVSVEMISKNFETIDSSISEDTNKQIKVLSDEENNLKLFKSNMDDRLNHSINSFKEKNENLFEKEKENLKNSQKFTQCLEEKFISQGIQVQTFVQNLTEFTQDQNKINTSFLQNFKNDDSIQAPIKKEIIYPQKLTKSKDEEILIKEYKEKFNSETRNFEKNEIKEIKIETKEVDRTSIQIPNSPLKRKKEEVSKKSIVHNKRVESIGNHSMKKRKMDKENIFE